MKRKLYFIKSLCFNILIFFLITDLSCYAAGEKPAFSIVTDKTSGAAVIHGLTKLTDALRAKNITFEKVESISEAKGKWIIVTGLASWGMEQLPGC